MPKFDINGRKELCWWSSKVRNVCETISKFVSMTCIWSLKQNSASIIKPISLSKTQSYTKFIFLKSLLRIHFTLKNEYNSEADLFGRKSYFFHYVNKTISKISLMNVTNTQVE